MENLIFSSFVFSVFAGILLVLRKTLNHRYNSRFFYGVWVLLLLRLVIPMNLFQNIAPIRISFDQVQERLFQNSESKNPEQLNENVDFLEQDQTNNFTEVPGVEKPLDENPSIQSTRFLGKSLNSNSLILLVWLSGIIISLGAILFSYIRFKKRIMKSITPMDSKHREAMEGLVDKRIEIFITKDLSSPLVMGLIRPKLILTQSLFETNNGQRNARLREGAKDVIHHELVHLQRKDMLVKYLYLLARTIHWFNPVIYKVGPVINEDIELACDEQVAKTMDANEKKNYCSFILDLASNVKLENSLYSTNFNGGLPFMKKRFGHIMESGKKRKGTALSVLLALVIISSALFVSCTAQETKEEPYSYNGETEITMDGRNFKLEDTPNNVAEETVIKSYLYSITGDFKGMSEILADIESHRISIKNEEIGFKDNNYIESYILHQVSTLTEDEYSEEKLESGEYNPLYYGNWEDIPKQYNLVEFEIIRVHFTQKHSEKSMELGPQWGDGKFYRNFIVGKSSNDSRYKIYDFGMM